jgi:hypothetical protein
VAASDSERDLLLVRLGDEFAARYRRGERPSLQEFIDRHPGLADDIRALFPTLVELEQVKEDRGDRRPDEAAPVLYCFRVPSPPLPARTLLRTTKRRRMTTGII